MRPSLVLRLLFAYSLKVQNRVSLSLVLRLYFASLIVNPRSIWTLQVSSPTRTSVGGTMNDTVKTWLIGYLVEAVTNSYPSENMGNLLILIKICTCLLIIGAKGCNLESALFLGKVSMPLAQFDYAECARDAIISAQFNLHQPFSRNVRL